MKLTITQNNLQTESEIIIQCSHVNKTLQKIIDYITQFTILLEGEHNNKIYQLSPDEIYYIDNLRKKINP